MSLSLPPPAPGRGRPLSPGPNHATPRQRRNLVLGLLAAAIFCLWLFSGILTPFVLAICIAYFLDPLATRLAGLGAPRTLSAAGLVVLLMLSALLIVLLVYPLLLAQIGTLLTRLPAYAASIGQQVRDLLVRLEDAAGPEMLDARLRELVVSQAGQMVSFLGTAATRLIGQGLALFSVFTYVVVTPIVAFYLLRDWPGIMLRIEAWLPRRSAPTLRQLAKETDRVLGGWFRGQLICCVFLMVFYAVGLSAVGLELALMVGLFAGVLSFIPYVGTFTGFVTSIVLASAQWGSWSGIWPVMVVFLAGHIIEGYIIYPRLLGDRVELHAVWVIFALFAGGVALGFLGVLLAVPIAAALGVLARFWMRRYLESPLYLDPPR
ncbi:AI-2E family transporter [Rhodovarius crocodyli]|uniref:AI-2E family transporter n=1 Tax=Rhodovarius crocodyli TaxID=1979269 RepID=A0A437MGN3_9PROT|nr:AI-2E family transporter [Rhodovarius crocodyli]RVT96765.1 AI-2E family transporter [Rhodovarius crocodyli]